MCVCSNSQRILRENFAQVYLQEKQQKDVNLQGKIILGFICKTESFSFFVIKFVNDRDMQVLVFYYFCKSGKILQILQEKREKP